MLYTFMFLLGLFLFAVCFLYAAFFIAGYKIVYKKQK